MYLVPYDFCISARSDRPQPAGWSVGFHRSYSSEHEAPRRHDFFRVVEWNFEGLFGDSYDSITYKDFGVRGIVVDSDLRHL